MYEGRGRDAWSRMSSLLALTANVHRGKRQRRITPDEMNPYVGRRGGRRGIRLTKQTIGVLKVFLPRRNRRLEDDGQRDHPA